MFSLVCKAISKPWSDQLIRDVGYIRIFGLQEKGKVPVAEIFKQPDVCLEIVDPVGIDFNGIIK